MIHVYMLVRVESLKNLEQNVNHVEAFETPMQDQN